MKAQSETDLLRIRIAMEELITMREGLIAENKVRESKGESLAYGEVSFWKIQEGLEQIRESIGDQPLAAAKAGDG